MRRTRLPITAAAAVLLGLTLSAPLAWADESGHDHAQEQSEATAHAYEEVGHQHDEVGHQHDENCDHSGTPWERGSVARTLRSDRNALIAVWVGISTYVVLIRRQGRSHGIRNEQEAAQ